MSIVSVSIRGGTMLDLLLTFTESNCEAVSKRWLFADSVKNVNEMGTSETLGRC